MLGLRNPAFACHAWTRDSPNEWISHRKQKKEWREERWNTLYFFAANAYFLPLTFWRDPNGPITIHSAISLSPICQHPVSSGEWQAGFKFRKAENRQSTGTGSYVSHFYFQKYPPPTHHFIVKCWAGAGPWGWDSRKRALLLSVTWCWVGFSEKMKESLLSGIFWSQIFQLCYFWKFRFSLVLMTLHIPSASLRGWFLWLYLGFKFINKCECAPASYLQAERSTESGVVAH